MVLIFLVPVDSSIVSVYGQGQVASFSRTPPGYNNQTGAFKLGGQLTNDAGNGGVCVMFDYFIFNAQAGQALQGSLLVTGSGRPIDYLVLNSPSQLYSFQNSNCGIGNWGQVEPASTVNWTAPEDGQYALMFITNGYYGDTVFFTQ